jgi:hypothetical protein
MSRIDHERSAFRGVHGPRPVPSAALPGDLGAGVTVCVARVPPNVIPAEAGTQYTAQREIGSMLERSVHPLRWEALCTDRERSAFRGAHGPRPVPSAALTGDLGAGVTLAFGASVSPPLRVWRHCAPQRHSGAGRNHI